MQDDKVFICKVEISRIFFSNKFHQIMRVFVGSVVDQVFRVIQKSILLKKMVDCKIFLTVHDAVMSIADHDSSLKLEVD